MRNDGAMDRELTSGRTATGGSVVNTSAQPWSSHGTALPALPIRASDNAQQGPHGRVQGGAASSGEGAQQQESHARSQTWTAAACCHAASRPSLERASWRRRSRRRAGCLPRQRQPAPHSKSRAGCTWMDQRTGALPLREMRNRYLRYGRLCPAAVATLSKTQRVAIRQLACPRRCASAPRA